MTDQYTTTRHITETENVVSFPGNGGTSARLASLESMQSMPDGMPHDFSLESDGVYRLQPGDGEDLLPKKICSPYRARLQEIAARWMGRQQPWS